MGADTSSLHDDAATYLEAGLGTRHLAHDLLEHGPARGEGLEAARLHRGGFGR